MTGSQGESPNDGDSAAKQPSPNPKAPLPQTKDAIIAQILEYKPDYEETDLPEQELLKVLRKLRSKHTRSLRKKTKVYRENHSLIEKRRRDKINQCISDLAALLPNVQDVEKIDKSSVLVATVAFVKEVTQNGALTGTGLSRLSASNAGAAASRSSTLPTASTGSSAAGRFVELDAETFVPRNFADEWRKFVSATLQGMAIVCNGQMVITQVSPSFTRVSGWMIESIRGVHLAKLIAPEVLPLFKQVLQTLEVASRRGIRTTGGQPIKTVIRASNGENLALHGQIQRFASQSEIYYAMMMYPVGGAVMNRMVPPAPEAQHAAALAGKEHPADSLAAMRNMKPSYGSDARDLMMPHVTAAAHEVAARGHHRPMRATEPQPRTRSPVVDDGSRGAAAISSGHAAPPPSQQQQQQQPQQQQPPQQPPSQQPPPQQPQQSQTSVPPQAQSAVIGPDQAAGSTNKQQEQVAVSKHTLDGTFCHASSPASDIFGDSVKNLLGQNIMHMCTTSDAPKLQDAFGEAMRKNEQNTVEIVFVRPNGTLARVEIKIRPFLNPITRNVEFMLLMSKIIEEIGQMGNGTNIANGNTRLKREADDHTQPSFDSAVGGPGPNSSASSAPLSRLLMSLQQPEEFDFPLPAMARNSNSGISGMRSSDSGVAGLEPRSSGEATDLPGLGVGQATHQANPFLAKATTDRPQESASAAALSRAMYSPQTIKKEFPVGSAPENGTAAAPSDGNDFLAFLGAGGDATTAANNPGNVTGGVDFENPAYNMLKQRPNDTIPGFPKPLGVPMGAGTTPVDDGMIKFRRTNDIGNGIGNDKLYAADNSSANW
eukprot:Clim_evm96s128 gene=Clim_evmTU96s128